MKRLCAHEQGMPQRGFSLVEVMVSLAAAVILMAGMASAVAVSTRSLALADAGNNARAVSTDVQRDLLADLQRATGFTERTPTAATFTVPDRTGDGRPETLRYAWASTTGTLTLQMNGGAVQNIATDVSNFALTYRTQSLAAPVVPDESPISSGRLLFVSGPSGLAPTFGQIIGGPIETPVTETNRDPKITLFQSWGFDVTAIAADQSQAEFDAACARNDAIYLSSDAGVSPAAARVANASIGIVNENLDSTEPLGFYQGAGNRSGTDTVIGITSHYITQNYFARQRVTVLNSASNLQAFLNPKATGLSILGVNITGDTVNFATLAPGRKRVDGSTAPGRRVQLPWAIPGSNFSTLTSDGKGLLKSSLLWAVGNGSDGNASLATVGITDSSLKVAYFTSTGGLMQASKLTLTSRGELMELSAFVRSNSLQLRLAIYSNYLGKPDARLAQTAVLTGSSSESWVTGAITPIILEPGTYWLAIALSDSTQRAYYDDPLTGTSSQISQTTFSSGLPATWVPGSGGSTNSFLLRQLLIYGSILNLP